jgi:hypothetical protein
MGHESRSSTVPRVHPLEAVWEKYLYTLEGVVVDSEVD